MKQNMQTHKSHSAATSSPVHTAASISITVAISLGFQYSIRCISKPHKNSELFANQFRRTYIQICKQIEECYKYLVPHRPSMFMEEEVMSCAMPFPLLPATFSFSTPRHVLAQYFWILTPWFQACNGARGSLESKQEYHDEYQQNNGMLVGEALQDLLPPKQEATIPQLLSWKDQTASKTVQWLNDWFWTYVWKEIAVPDNSRVTCKSSINLKWVFQSKLQALSIRPFSTHIFLLQAVNSNQQLQNWCDLMRQFGFPSTTALERDLLKWLGVGLGSNNPLNTKNIQEHNSKLWLQSGLFGT